MFALTEEQTQAVMAGADRVPPAWRARFLDSIADRLTGIAVSDDAVEQAVSATPAAAAAQSTDRSRARAPKSRTRTPCSSSGPQVACSLCTAATVSRTALRTLTSEASARTSASKSRTTA